MRRAGKPDLLLLHLPKPFLHPLAVMGRGAGRCNGNFQVSRHPWTLSSQICSGMFISGTRGGGGPAEVPGDELVQAGGQDGSLSSC